ncbi:Sec-independent protein translocase protein TatB [Asticcacaulis sp. EMRT-3]|uniref:Sec-independent protein translocase protein TatB n=1 Tax=Asticcacaulis sp. EMRT-3 TaxID=3040349 RepID=UPI0024AF7B1B|nr:Sec-independent protein translocase protein TatB [Asticcacaulis sp. EMRT-3]MDI7774310.1 Sec-independent protein translocase protein TatB [Asticcacaulis sp. EMRT-3]
MVPGIGGGELVVIAVVALIVVGPKDLPKLLRQLGRFVGKMRRMADEFRTSFEDMARQSELDELRKEVDALRANTSQPSIVSDINSQMRAIETDINAPAAGSFTPAPAAPIPTTPIFSESLADLAPAEPVNPQLEGLPPRSGAKTRTNKVAEPAPATVKAPRKRAVKATPATSEPTLSAPKKPRAPRKPKAKA